jgi:hypothetical protein
VSPAAWLRVVLVNVALLAAAAAGAHPLAPSLLQLSERADGLVEVEWRRPVRVPPGGDRSALLPPSCRRIDTLGVSADEVLLTERFTADCGARGLVGERVGVAGLGVTGADALLRIRLRDGRVLQHVLRPDAESVVVPERTPRLEVARDYGRLGLDHILSGADHLLFVLGLVLLVGGGRRLLATVTAFTAGHSVTLSLAAVGFVRFPTRPIELGIALTVFWLAVELARPGATRDSWMRRAPWLMASGFGLLHGLGFAGALAETGLPPGEIPLALLAFNLGIESGQVLFVAALLAAGAALRTLAPPLPAWSGRVPLYAMGSLAAFWCLERAALLVR